GEAGEGWRGRELEKLLANTRGHRVGGFQDVADGGGRVVDRLVAAAWILGRAVGGHHDGLACEGAGVGGVCGFLSGRVDLVPGRLAVRPAFDDGECAYQRREGRRVETHACTRDARELALCRPQREHSGEHGGVAVERVLLPVVGQRAVDLWRGELQHARELG